MSVYHYDNARVARRLVGFILVIIGVVLMTLLYYVKISAQSAKSDMRRLETQIAQEERALKVLRAELAFLENPARLQDLAKDHLGLEATGVEQIIAPDDIPQIFERDPSEISSPAQPQQGQAQLQGQMRGGTR